MNIPEPSLTTFDRTSTVRTFAQRSGGAPWRLELPHARDAHLLFWVTRGSARAMVEGEILTLSSHNALFIPARTLFSFSFEAACFGLTVQLPPNDSLPWPERTALLRIREPKKQLELTHYIEAIQSECDGADVMGDHAIAAYAQLMMVWAHRQIGPVRDEKPSASQRLVRAFCALIVQSERMQDPPRAMAQFAARLGVTPTHLTRVCKEQCNITAADLITQHTVQRARRFLEETRLSASAIATQLGFSSAAYFTRFMTAHTGKTPSALRVKHR